MGALAAWGVAEGDWASVWQAVIVDLFSGGAHGGIRPAPRRRSRLALTLWSARRFCEALRGPIDALDSQVAGSRAVTFDRRIVAANSLARDRFDSDCVLGTG